MVEELIKMIQIVSLCTVETTIIEIKMLDLQNKFSFVM